MFLGFLFLEHFDHYFLFNLWNFIDFFNHSVENTHYNIGKVGYSCCIIEGTVIQSSHKVSLKQWHKLLSVLLRTLLCGHNNSVTKIVPYFIYRNYLCTVRNKRDNMVVELVK